MTHLPEYLSYNDVCLVPQYNNVDSRTEPLLDTWLTRNVSVKMPLVAAPMDTVINAQLARKLREHGTLPIFHRFTTVEQQKEWIDEFGQNCFISTGINDVDKTIELLKYSGVNGPAKGVLIDVAHGHSSRLIEYVQKIKRSNPNIEIIAGSVATEMSVQDLYVAGADAIRVGIGAGSACTTRLVTGYGLPMFTCVRECARIASKLRVPVIADGGIEHPKDIAIALAAGAMTVMMGKKFAMVEESAAPKVSVDGKLMVKYRGQASANFQKDYYGGVKKGTVPEGMDFSVPCSGTADELIEYYLGSLRSAFTYAGARDIKEFQRKAEFVKVGAGYMGEAHVRAY
jgi:IMP dehydrogenase